MVKKSLVFVVNKALFYFYQTLYSKVSKVTLFKGIKNYFLSKNDSVLHSFL